MTYTMTIRPGFTVRIVTDVDMIGERIHVKSSIVYDVHESTITLAQTEPPLLKSTLNKEITVTYLSREKEGPVRYGFPATIKEFIDNYKLSSSNEARAVIVTRKSAPYPYNLRMFYRVEPTSRSGVSMSVYGREVNILDISLGGARLSYRQPLSLEPERRIEVCLSFNGKAYSFEATVLRTWEGDNERLKGELAFASIEFVNMAKGLEQDLSMKIREIERDVRFNELLP